MILECKKFINKSDLIDAYIPDINFSDKVVNDLLRKGVAVDRNSLCNVLNMINNQGITDVNLQTREYCVDGKVLSLDFLSSSERVFLISYLAEVTKRKIYLANQLKRLTQSSILKWFKLFKNSEYVNVAYSFEESRNYYNNRLEMSKNV